MTSRRTVRHNRGRAGGSSAPFSPRILSGLDLWLDAGLGITLNGSDVSAWADQGTAGNNFAQGTAALQPAYQATGGPGGRPAVYFGIGGALASTAEHLVGPGFSGSAGEIFFVTKKDNEASSGDGGLARFGSVAQGEHVPFSDGNHYATFGTTARKSTGTDPGVHTNWYLINWISAAGEWTGRFNRSQYFTTGTNTVGWHTSSSLGTDLLGNVSYWVGHIAAVYKFNRKLTTGERTQMENYILSRWGV